MKIKYFLKSTYERFHADVFARATRGEEKTAKNRLYSAGIYERTRTFVIPRNALCSFPPRKRSPCVSGRHKSEKETTYNPSGRNCPWNVSHGAWGNKPDVPSGYFSAPKDTRDTGRIRWLGHDERRRKKCCFLTLKKEIHFESGGKTQRAPKLIRVTSI